MGSESVSAGATMQCASSLTAGARTATLPASQPTGCPPWISALPPELEALKEKVRDFIADEVIAYETDERVTHHGPTDGLRDELVIKARRAGLLTPHASRELGGLGLSHVEKAIVFEEAGYSTLWPDRDEHRRTG